MMSTVCREQGGNMKKLQVLALVGILVLGLGAAAFATGGEEEGAAAEAQVKFAAVLPGSIQDADYNTIGYVALQEAGQAHGAQTAYSEKVAVPDAERVLTEYCVAGFDIIWVHGSQFNGAAAKVGPEYPDVTFIIEVDSEPADKLPNFWYMDRNFYTGFYVLGALAALTTETGQIGYIGGLELPFTRAEINAIRQAIRDVGSDAVLDYLYIGDFNDPVKTRQAAEGLIANGIDVIISSVNLGNYGLYNAAKDAGEGVYITTKYTDKTDLAPDNFLTSDLFDFKVPLTEILGRFIDGEKGGFLYLDYGEGLARATQFPIRNVSDAVNAQVREIATAVAAGEIDIARNQQEILD